MSKRMLIDASHPEETRVVVLDGNKVEEFDFESASKRPLKGNIYLAKVTRVEPSLQAAFVEYGGNRQGFLAFSEIHPDYYQIPVADRMALLEAQTQRMMAEEEEIESFDTQRRPGESAEASEPAQDEHQEDEHEDADAADAERASDNGAPEEEHEAVDESLAPPEDGAPSEPEEEPESESGAAAEAEANDALVIEAETGRPVEAADTQEPVVTVQQRDVLAESTGAPEPYQRRERRNDRPRPRRRQYKIQEVIKRRQVMLVQVVKEERGTKGASLTTFLSLAGRYCVLMPNTPRGGGISRKITSATDRKRLKSAAQSLDVPEGMGLIIRTAGANRTKAEIKRDYEYLLRLWDNVRELTLRSNAPALVYEEGSLIKRAIRDLYNKDISEIVVDGDDAYRDAKDFMRMIMPSHAKNVKQYREALPLFQRFRVESQLDAMFSPIVHLRSGGYIVINQTEALVSIDVNSGKATREHSIEETATKTNLEAADEIARQLRLRDLAGLIVIDFIDMEDSKNDRNVEKRLHNAVKNDRARIQIGKISQFGLLEMSRQRLRSGVIAGSTITCPHCAGIGLIRSTESAALRLLRALDEEGQRAPAANVRVRAPEDVTIYTLNQKRREISRIEEAYDLAITFDPQATMVGGTFELERTGARTPSLRPKTAVSVEAGFVSSVPEEPETDVTIIEAPAEAEPQHAEHERESVDAAESTEQPNGEGRRRRRRRRRGGRGRGPHGEPAGTVSDLSTQPSAAHQSEAGGSAEFESEPDEAAGEEAAVESLGPQSQTGVPGSQHGGSQGEGGGRRRRRRRGRRGRRHEGDMSVQTSGPANTQVPQSDTAAAAGIAPFTPEPLEDSRERFTPNAPSQPQWSLSEREHRSEPANPIADLNVRAAPPAIGRTEAAPDVAASSEEPASSEEAPASTAHEDELDANREPRKGWWQRRFKL